MPTLLQINSTANWGSTGKIAEQIGELVMSHGWDSYIAYGRYANNSQSQLIRIGSKVSQAWHLLISRLFDRHGLASKCATKRLIKKIEQIKPDIIHLHNIHGYYINYEILFNYLQSIDTPVVWTLHDCWAFTGHCAHFVEQECYKWRIGCDNCPLRDSYPKSFSDRANKNYKLKSTLFRSRRNIAIVPVSNWLANFVRQSFLKDKQITVINNGIDTNVFYPQQTQEKEYYNILGVSSTWSNSKGLNDFYKLRTILGADKYHITLVGLTKQQIADLPDGIIGIERTNSIQELAHIYSDASVFVNPTYADTFPTTNLEALSCGTPIVTYKTGGCPETICSNSGIIVEQGDIKALKIAIEQVCSNGKAYYNRACRKRAEEYFDKNKCFLQYLELYNELIKTR